MAAVEKFLKQDATRIVCPACHQVGLIPVILAGQCCRALRKREAGAQEGESSAAQDGLQQDDVAPPETKYEKQLRRQKQRDEAALAADIFFPQARRRQKFSQRRLVEMARPLRKRKLQPAGTSLAGAGARLVKSDLPGPGSHDLPSGLQVADYCGRFSLAETPTAVDAAVLAGRDVPGPGQYNLPSLGDLTPGGRFSNACPKSALDMALSEAAAMPGPDRYCLPDRLQRMPGGKLPRGGRGDNAALQRAREMPGPADAAPSLRFGGGAALPGGKFSDAHPLSELDMSLREARRMPGPGRYSPGIPAKNRGSPQRTANGGDALDHALKTW